jgi:hypothetical protein
MSLSVDQLNAILDRVDTALGGITITTPAATPKETNIIKVDFFHGTIDEDPNEWIEKFERAKDANNWANARLHHIAGGLLKDEAADWYQATKSTIAQWSHATATDTFREKFIARFSTVERLHK